MTIASYTALSILGAFMCSFSMKGGVSVPRKLTPEEKAKALQKPWATRPKLTTDPSKLRQLQALSGPKTPEGKAKALDNLIVGQTPRIKHGGYVRSLMTIEEADVYDHWKGKFLQEFPDLNESSDQLILEQILMEKVIEYRLLKAKLEKPTMNIDKPLSDCQQRMRKAMEDLGVSRRVRMTLDQPTVNNFAQLMLSFERERQNYREISAQYREEEEAFMRSRALSQPNAAPLEDKEDEMDGET